MKITIALTLAILISGCSVTSVKQYDGPIKTDDEVSIIRLWSPYLLIESMDGKSFPNTGWESHAYILPGSHKFDVNLVKIQTHNFLCGALCDALFDNNYVVADTEAGHSYIFTYIDGENPKIVIEDKGTNYNPECLNPENFDPRKDLQTREHYLKVCG